MSRRRRPEVYWRAGGRGPELVLLNGWSASGLAWPRTWVRELEKDFRVIRIDNRGSGYSRFAPTPFTMADLADDVAAVLDDAGAERATVLGLSMGGMIAQEFALRHPRRIDGLILTATAPPAPAYVAGKLSGALLGLMQPPRKHETLETYFTRVWAGATGAGFADREPEAIDELVAQIVARPTARQTLRHQLRAATGWGHADRLSCLDTPTAIIHGDEDQLVDVVNGRRLGALIPNARYVELPGVGHLPPLEAPAIVLDAIRSVAPARQEAQEEADRSAA